MPNLDSIPAAKMAGVALSLRDCLVRLKQRGQLQTLLREAVLEAFLCQQAGAAGLVVSIQQLQFAVDAWRRRLGLNSAEQTNSWLKREGLSVKDLECAVERDLLVAGLREHVTGPLIAGHFAAHPDRYERVRLAQIVVDRVDLARELLTHIRQEGGDFAQLAREHSLHAPSRERGGDLGVVLRRQLPPGVETVFTANSGEVVGPVALPDGFHLFRVGARSPAVLDGPTTEVIRKEVFDAWLAESLGGAQAELPLLEEL